MRTVLTLLLIVAGVSLTGWPALQPPAVAETSRTANQCLDTTKVDAILGTGNWQKLEGYENGVIVTNLPDQQGGFFFVTAPVIQVDKQGISYRLGAQVPADGGATVWFDGSVASCSTFLPLLQHQRSFVPFAGTVLWHATDQTGYTTFLGPDTPNIEDLLPAHCALPIDDEDAGAQIVTQDGQQAVELIANARARPGVYLNALTHRNIYDHPLDNQFLHEHVYGRRWVAWGEFRRGSAEQIQNNAINFQLVDSHKQEHIALIQWILNPEDRNNYGWITVRTKTDGSADEQVHYIGDDQAWHRWQMTIEFSATDGQVQGLVRDIAIDGNLYSKGWAMPILPDKPWSDSFALLLEVTNLWTNCQPNAIHVGSFYFRNMGVGYLD